MLYFARPTPQLLALGTALAAFGECLRLWAAGHLEKDRGLTTSGPYAFTRNPLYLGSFIVGAGFVVAAGRPSFLLLLVILFAAVYRPVMRREALRLQSANPGGYDQYAARVPLFWPWPGSGGDGEAFSWKRVARNREHHTVVGVVLVVAILAGKLLLRL